MKRNDVASPAPDTTGDQYFPNLLAAYMLGHDTREFRVGENVDGMFHKIRCLEEALKSLKDCMKPNQYSLLANQLHRLSEYLGSGVNKRTLQPCHSQGFPGMNYCHTATTCWIGQVMKTNFNIRFAFNRLAFNRRLLGMTCNFTKGIRSVPL